MSGDFPKGFIWGAATAAHQVEGANTNSDCWALEHARPSLFKEPSGDAADHWNRFGDDVAILSAIGLQAYRFSIEWARIEPDEGVFAQSALDHYQRCIDICLQHGVAPILTFHHFTNPLWVARQGGMTNPRFADWFARYCEKAASSLRGFDHACTINELNLPLFVRTPLLNRLRAADGEALIAAAQAALGAPIDSFFIMAPREAVLKHGLGAHAKARDAIKAAHPHCQVGVTLAVQDEQAEPGGEALRDQRNADFYNECLDFVRGDDFIGVQTYTRVVSDKTGATGPSPGHPLTMMGYEDRPQAIASTCRYVWERTQTPILITENGWAGTDDRRRGAFVQEAVGHVHDALADGVDIRGYLYWSLLDNFEWLSGYGPKFGLIGFDRETQRRHIKPSALLLGEIAQRNSLKVAAQDPEILAATPESTPIGLNQPARVAHRK